MIKNTRMQFFIFILISLFLHILTFIFINEKFSLNKNTNVIEIQLLQKEKNIRATSVNPISDYEKVTPYSDAPKEISKTINHNDLVTTKVAVDADVPEVFSATSTNQPIYSPATLGIHIFYPRLSRVFKEQGQVILNIRKNARNQIEKIEIEKSSGYLRLDDAAVESTKNHNFANSKIQNEFKISFVFKLTY